MQVSYKKQFVLGIIGIVILLLAVELVANVWWITQINCEFEQNEIFQDIDVEKKKQLCCPTCQITPAANARGEEKSYRTGYYDSTEDDPGIAAIYGMFRSF